MKMAMIAVLIICVTPIALGAQSGAPEAPSVRPVPLFPVEMPTVVETVGERIRSDPAYRPNHWKTGALVGAAVGLGYSVFWVALCEGDCASWDRIPLGTLVGAGVGALIGALIPSSRACAK